ncbi:DNA topoisomerase IV [Flavobacterium sp.]|uniref:DNA topoisomerase IV n=1 Tax=Flavobacterium sp. TaxID=239 RepID=UPI00120F283D|nr:DNA topoisomerase IV [Flavobacterium sp.]RZJ72263.1 MAG: DNA topoisomerase IV [Flavobacterium sp.]
MRIPSNVKKGFALLLLLQLLLSTTSCYETQRECKDFKTGEFEFKTKVDGVMRTTKFVRNDTLEIDFYQGKSDTSSIRWVNDCEYIVQKLHPKNMAERKAIAMKILTTSKNSYTFEYGNVGSAATQKGTVTKIK